ncbi:hypothetical protein [Psychrobacillus soli]|uniref:Uncharacterized protein n=1 Tax=Psychrobacillus soli TaxID=1543965 RepID=A0A544SKU5_9BACI|nr:hypothetical protein [Psychrobacillus soli]TQR05803.1 hypothetical protein FG383_19405 [Psychrobacillus soli]
MEENQAKLLESKQAIEKLAYGINPIDGSAIVGDHLLNKPQVIRHFFVLLNFLDSELEKKQKKTSRRKRPNKVVLTSEQLERVELPKGLIGINEFARAVNLVIDETVSKKLTGAAINKKLKEIGVLSEEKINDNRKRTVVNGNSIAYGIESMEGYYNGEAYERVVFNDIGKEFLMKNLIDLMTQH